MSRAIATPPVRPNVRSRLPRTTWHRLNLALRHNLPTGRALKRRIGAVSGFCIWAAIGSFVFCWATTYVDGITKDAKDSELIGLIFGVPTGTVVGIFVYSQIRSRQSHVARAPVVAAASSDARLGPETAN